MENEQYAGGLIGVSRDMELAVPRQPKLGVGTGFRGRVSCLSRDLIPKLMGCDGLVMQRGLRSPRRHRRTRLVVQSMAARRGLLYRVSFRARAYGEMPDGGRIESTGRVG